MLISASLKGIYAASDLTDYTGELEARTQLRITDKHQGVASTVLDFPLSFAIPCTATADTATGSTCALSTSADAVRPGSVPEGDRSLWALDQVRVYDGGADGDGDTAGDNQLFEVQGLFVP